MNAKAAVVTLFGVVVALLGALWFVQGIGLVRVPPVFCVADCEPVTGASLQWTIIGAIALFVGLGSIRVGLRRVTR